METLKIATSNIRFANPADGHHDWPFRLPLLSEIYKNFGLDILGTQEGRLPQLKELDKQLPELELIDLHRNWIDERMYPCLFVNPKNIFVAEAGDIWLSETPHVAGSKSFESTFPRLCTWAKVTMKSSGLKIIVVNTHLDHVLSTTRQKQIQVLISEIKKISNLPVIIVGDFNESPLTEIKSKLLLEFNLKDPWNEFGYPEETSHHNFLGDKCLDGDRIDWILIPKKFECLNLKLEKQSMNNGSLYPSDHYPLFATLVPK